MQKNIFLNHISISIDDCSHRNNDYVHVRFIEK